MYTYVHIVHGGGLLSAAAPSRPRASRCAGLRLRRTIIIIIIVIIMIIMISIIIIIIIITMIIIM